MWEGSFGFDLQVQDFYSETYNRRLSTLPNSGKTDNGFSDFEMEVESRLWKSVLIKWPWAAHSASLILPVRQYSWNIYLYQSLNGKWNLENKKINSFLPESLCLALTDREFSPHLSVCTGLLGAEEKLCFKAYGPKKNRESLSSVQTVFFFFFPKSPEREITTRVSICFLFLHSKFFHTSAMCSSCFNCSFFPIRLEISEDTIYPFLLSALTKAAPYQGLTCRTLR